MAHDIFISYGHEDKSTADAACAVLESEGLRCWIAPRDILPGNEWTMSIMDGIVHAKAMVLIFSHHSDASPQVRREVERAIHHGIPVVPVRIEDVLPSEAMEYLISTPHWLDAMTAPLESHYRRLAASLKLLIQQRNGVNPSDPATTPKAFHSLPPPQYSKFPKVAVVAVIVVLLLAAGIYGVVQMTRRPGNVQAVVQPPQSSQPSITSQLPQVVASPRAPQPTLIPASSMPVVSASPTTIPVAAIPAPQSTAPQSIVQQPPQPSNPPTPAGEILTNSIGMKFVEIKPGTFLMGSPPTEEGRSDDETQHKVTLTKGFFMGQTPVTVGQFMQFLSDSGYRTDAEKRGSAVQWIGQTWAAVPGGCWRNPGFPQDADHPVVDVSWNDATAFCAWISQKEAKKYRLPTEAEWEYCARAGTTTAYQWGDNPDDGKGWANFLDAEWRVPFPQFPTFSWSDGYVYTSPVGKFRPNAWNLYDMPGNVLEWCSDWFGDYPNGDTTDPQGPARDDAKSIENGLLSYAGPGRVRRGGSWASFPRESRIAARGGAAPFGAWSKKGFRLVLDSQ